MRVITSDILERRQRVQADLDEWNARREVLEKRLAALDTLLEMEQEVNGAPQDIASPMESGVKKQRVPLTPEVARVLQEHPDWELLPRNEQMQRISEQLLVDGYDFRGKGAFLAVGFALTWLKRGMGVKQNGSSLKDDDGSPR